MDPSSFTIPKPPGWATLPLHQKILHYRSCLDHRFAPFVDKLEAKRIVKEICGDLIQVARVVRVLDGPDDIHASDLQPNHIIKSTHGSGWNICINEHVTVNSVKLALHGWNRPYNHEVEPHYAHIPPRFFIEEIISDAYTGATGQALVYMIRCIRGLPIVIRVKATNGASNTYDLEWNMLMTPELPFPVARPTHLAQMIQAARMLSAPFEFVRMDFHLDTEGRPFFSEYTFTPAGGSKIFTSELEQMLGALWI